MNVTLLFETLAISGTIVILSGAPLYLKKVMSHSKFFFLLGTGALAGICIFELVPEVFHMGGKKTLLIIGLVWAAYTLIHIFYLDHHVSKSKGMVDPGHTHHSTPVFLSSMVIHCLSSGMLLVLSDDVAGGFGRTVFLALLAHKTYEALTVSSILLETEKNRVKIFISISIYALSFPLGVLSTLAFGGLITKDVALYATSFAVGTLLGCLVSDFLLPSFVHIRNRRHDVAWIAAGLITSQLMFWVLL